MLTVLIFIVILGILIFVHELGHFLVAKKAGVQVDEFGFGYPPRAATVGQIKGTPITLNWIPFGGFVKIFGENYEETSPSPLLVQEGEGAGFPSPEQGEGGRRPGGVSFTQVSKKWQAAILAAGVTFNVLFAWLLFSLGFLVGMPAPVENSYGAPVQDPRVTIINVLKDSPAEKAGLKTGDKILSLSGSSTMEVEDPENVSVFVNVSEGPVLLEVLRGRELLNFEVNPELDPTENKKLIGIELDLVGTLRLPVHRAVYEGGRTTLEIFYLTAAAIGGLVKDAFVGQADISQIAGPVGIVGLVGDASRLGFAYLLSFTALISVNLAVINLFPFPVLDGGRIVMVAVEGLFKKKINPKVAGALNTVGFALLILLMLFITYRDILKLF